MRRITKRHKKFIWLLVFLSILLLFLLPLDEVIVEVSSTLPSVLTGVAITESLFIIGLFAMALSVEHDLGPNPLKWSEHLHTVVHHIPDNRLFWLGFWTNAIGALGSGLVVATGVVMTLPVQSWGVIWLPFLDLSLTITLRASILELKREYALEEKKP